jgi:hypothetical protein
MEVPWCCGPILVLSWWLDCARRRIAKATGATVVTTLADMEGNETFDPACLGAAEEVLKLASTCRDARVQ